MYQVHEQVEMIDNKLMYEQVDKRKNGGLPMPG
jgi:hypothetical protein